MNKTNLDNEKRFLYQPNFLKMGLLAMVFGGLSAFAAFTPYSGKMPRFLVFISDNIGLDEVLLIKIIGFLGLAITIFALVVIVYSKVSNGRYVILAKNSLFTPASNFNSKLHEIRFVDIFNVKIMCVVSQKFIRIEHKAGKIDLSQTMFKSKDIFNECYLAILKSIQLEQNLINK